ncbi:uncharacterized protein L969DRAFT_54965 [Mixia osmundae IAM 14324]|uniref:Uncharacterized protein n=1 Tax=Mixia osmundae (strain CBS 9802 / IAM 14324 / JCM 22182 / KY 12970) TaxID=764103 RepID=G7DW33_MIXOS|nr:uncharacterized protein L969DRAFT_54965 [Mixia osmundae IAM 14324]KEI36588.1 hypothetical protein L969DRAFT_54965 [Mixia osmundae IAM 14324]GAA94839.1 hypothetical protein E5Q_01493 [Mixia osmundae IAM 14324]
MLAAQCASPEGSPTDITSGVHSAARQQQGSRQDSSDDEYARNDDDSSARPYQSSTLFEYTSDEKLASTKDLSLPLPGQLEQNVKQISLDAPMPPLPGGLSPIISGSHELAAMSRAPSQSNQTNAHTNGHAEPASSSHKSSKTVSRADLVALASPNATESRASSPNSRRPPSASQSRRSSGQSASNSPAQTKPGQEPESAPMSRKSTADSSYQGRSSDLQQQKAVRSDSPTSAARGAMRNVSAPLAAANGSAGRHSSAALYSNAIHKQTSSASSLRERAVTADTARHSTGSYIASMDQRNSRPYSSYSGVPILDNNTGPYPASISSRSAIKSVLYDGAFGLYRPQEQITHPYLPEMRPSARDAKPSASAPMPPSLPLLPKPFPLDMDSPTAAGKPANGPEVCIECMMRDRDLADTDVTSPGIWARASDAAYEEALRREEADEQSSIAGSSHHSDAPNSHDFPSTSPNGREKPTSAPTSREALGSPSHAEERARSKSMRIGRGHMLTQPALKLWTSMNIPASNHRWKTLQTYLADQAQYLPPEAAAPAESLRQPSLSSERDAWRNRTSVIPSRVDSAVLSRTISATSEPRPETRARSRPHVKDAWRFSRAGSRDTAPLNPKAVLSDLTDDASARRFSSPLGSGSASRIGLHYAAKSSSDLLSPARPANGRAEARPLSLWSRTARSATNSMLSLVPSGSMVDMHLGLSYDRHRSMQPMPHLAHTTSRAQLDSMGELMDHPTQQSLPKSASKGFKGLFQRIRSSDGKKQRVRSVASPPILLHDESGGRQTYFDLAEPLTPPPPLSFLTGQSSRRRASVASAASSQAPQSPSEALSSRPTSLFMSGVLSESQLSRPMPAHSSRNSGGQQSSADTTLDFPLTPQSLAMSETGMPSTDALMSDPSYDSLTSIRKAQMKSLPDIPDDYVEIGDREQWSPTDGSLSTTKRKKPKSRILSTLGFRRTSKHE